MPNKIKISLALQGFTNIVTDTTIGITELVETMHKQISSPPFLPSSPIQELTSSLTKFTYGNIKKTTHVVGKRINKVLEKYASVMGEIELTNRRENRQSFLNGVIGDYLEENNNPLKITMQFRYQGSSIFINKENLAKKYPVIKSKVLLMIHGLCLNDSHWNINEHNHGEKLAKELGFTPIYLYYNSGRHISTNGQNLNELLEELVLGWSIPVEELIILTHSMGGLISRSAIYYGEKQQKTWIKYLKKIFFLGTPHHGAPMEVIGNYFETTLKIIPYTRPFARLGRIRSAGVTDLRFGNLLDDDWENRNRFKLEGDKRCSVPLPEKIECYSIAATVSKETKVKNPKLKGDGLVEVASALGIHKNKNKNLNFKKNNTWIAYENKHIDLLSSLDVYSKIKDWIV